MTFTLDTATPLGQLRTLLSDTDAGDVVFHDETLQVFLAVGGSVDRAWARALLAAIPNVGLRQHLARKLGIEADPASVMRELRLLADTVLKQFAPDDATTDADEYSGLFDVIEFGYDDFSTRELRAATALRSLP